MGVLDGAKNEGRAEGRAEGHAEVAKSMKRKGYPLEEIMELTGLTSDQIEALD
jgi:predicted transposase/invertase (TIGR01784 family)